ncbi:MAG: hypothetical protein IJV16_10825 [Lachnospiraceae bacterium]|nr:hypothetical protein [Lachnospiraceae bacterium]
MNLVEGLLKADQAKAQEYERGTYKSKRLAKILGKKEPVEITIREIDLKTIRNIREYSTKKDGTTDPKKLMDSNYMLIAKGIVDPDLNNQELQKHFGASDAMELAEILFRFEGNFIADEIVKLSNMTIEDAEDIIKN